MTKKIYASVIATLCFSSLAMADNYSENLMVFTSNTMERGCTTAPAVIYQGTKKDYVEFFKKEMNELAATAKANESGSVDKSGLVTSVGLGAQNALNSVAVAANGALLASGKDMLAHGLAGMGVGLAHMAINAGINESMMDYEYLYVTECNKNSSDRTRLMTLVVSNDKLEEPKWIELAKEDQAKALK